MYDELGNMNNVLEVQEYIPENLESLSSFDPPPSPVSRYGFRQTFETILELSTYDHIK